AVRTDASPDGSCANAAKSTTTARMIMRTAILLPFATRTISVTTLGASKPNPSIASVAAGCDHGDHFKPMRCATATAPQGRSGIPLPRLTLATPTGVGRLLGASDIQAIGLR